ncbi:hypothetical protein [Bacillus sp. 1NLA3E]|uniref:hypothetical protein n=1 Tax=Bacillus sp. 1NLA3E TaxID=666686 RepID=UPI000247E69E|nr:hypothetical protein [Bacillus sp. 1NLA3E]
MERNIQTEDIRLGSFQELIVKAYERGTSDTEITVGKLLEDLIFDLKNMIVK